MTEHTELERLRRFHDIVVKQLPNTAGGIYESLDRQDRDARAGELIDLREVNAELLAACDKAFDFIDSGGEMVGRHTVLKMLTSAIEKAEAAK